ncbi:MAG: ankyrin repeat domain-containing protein [Oligoflexia bacterium]|nr:ankyrin repeat domain-containing protein [Oligoflexia bacterium]
MKKNIFNLIITLIITSFLFFVVISISAYAMFSGMRDPRTMPPVMMFPGMMPFTSNSIISAIEREDLLTLQKISLSNPMLLLDVDGKQNSVIDIAILLGKNNLVKKFINSMLESSRPEVERIVPNLLNSVNVVGMSALDFAADRDQWGLYKYLLTKGCTKVNNNWNKEGASHIAFAAMSGDLEKLQLLQKTNANFALVDSNGDIPLNYIFYADSVSVEDDSLQTAKFIIDNMQISDLSKKNNKGKTTLDLAADRGAWDIYEYLLKKGVPVNTSWKNEDDQSPLIIATARKNTNLALQLINSLNVSEVEVLDKNGNSALKIAASKNNVQIISALIKKGVSLTNLDKKGFPPLFHTLVKKGEDEITVNMDSAKLIIDNMKTSDLSSIKIQGKKSIMDMVAHYGLLDLYMYLIQKGVKANNPWKDQNGKTPLMYAIEDNNKNHFDIIVNSGLSLDESDNNGDSALVYAMKKENTKFSLDIINKLDKDALNRANKNGEVPVLSAIKMNDISVLRALIARDINLITQDKKGKLPLQHAIKSNKIEFAKLIINKMDKSELNHINGVGKTFLMIAAETGVKAIFEYLIQSGVDINIKNSQDKDKSAFDYYKEKFGVNFNKSLINPTIVTTTPTTLQDTGFSFSEKANKLISDLSNKIIDYNKSSMESQETLNKNIKRWALLVTDVAREVCGVVEGSRTPNCVLDIKSNRNQGHFFSIVPTLKKGNNMQKLDQLELKIFDVFKDRHDLPATTNKRFFYNGNTRKDYTSYIEATYSEPQVINPFQNDVIIQPKREVIKSIEPGLEEKSSIACKIISLKDETKNGPAARYYADVDNPKTTPSNYVYFDNSTCYLVDYNESTCKLVDGKDASGVLSEQVFKVLSAYKTSTVLASTTLGNIKNGQYILESGKIIPVKSDFKVQESSETIAIAPPKGNSYFRVLAKNFKPIAYNKFLSSLDLDQAKLDKNELSKSLISIKNEVGDTAFDNLKQIVLSDWNSLNDKEVLKILGDKFINLKEILIRHPSFPSDDEKTDFRVGLQEIQSSFKSLFNRNLEIDLIEE